MNSLVLVRSPLSLFARRAFLGGAALLVALSSQPALVAQVEINFGSPTAVFGPSDIVTTGTFHAAIGATASAVTVAGVTFATSSPLITVSNATVIGYTPGGFESTASPYTANVSSYEELINRGYFTPVGDKGRIDLSGLTIGHEYRIQIWTPAWDADFPTRIVYEGTLDFGNAASTPKYAVGTITASASSEYFEFGATDSMSRGLIAAIAVYDVTAIPEPSTYAAIVGAAALGFSWWRRRRRA